MKKVYYLFLFSCLYKSTNAQSLRYAVAAPYLGTTAYSTLHSDAFSFINNQATLAQQKQAAAGAFAERRFLLAELNNYNLVLTAPTALGNFGVHVNYAGFTNFTENKIGLAYAKNLGQKMSAGIQFNYYGYRIPSYQNASTVSVEAALLYHFTPKLNGGIQVINPIGGKLLKANSTYNLGEEKLASVYSFGLGYDASESFYTSLQISKEEDKPVNVTGGFQYRFASQFFARAGFVSESSIAYAGAGVKFNNIRIDLSASYHQQLGISPGILLIAEFGKNKKNQ